jgi:hypothetical protein
MECERLSNLTRGLSKIRKFDNGVAGLVNFYGIL